MKNCYHGQQVFLKSAESQRKNKTAKRRLKFSQGTRYIPLTNTGSVLPDRRLICAQIIQKKGIQKMVAKRKWINRFYFDENNNILKIELEKDGMICQVYTTYKEECVDDSFLYDIENNYWTIDSNGYPYCYNLKCSLHHFVMKKWYGEEIFNDFLSKNYVVDHIDNNRCNARIDNLEFLAKNMNTAKGQMLDPTIPDMRSHIALGIYKNFSTGEYQITIGVNDFDKKIQLITLKGEVIYAYVNTVYLTYNSNIRYNIVILDATKILEDYKENFRINLRATSASREKGSLRKHAIMNNGIEIKEDGVKKMVRFNKVAPKFDC